MHKRHRTTGRRMMSLPQIQKALEDRKLIVVAERVGISYNKLRDIYNGATRNVDEETVKKLTDYLKKNN
jgi:hypothetical protein